jgi:monovalent cation:H+ antiporter-2, CPA2 family
VVLAYVETADYLLNSIVAMLLGILLLGWLLRRFRQPYFIAYIIAGIILGPHGIALFTDVETIAQIGSLGLIIQMFFIGAEIEVHSLVKNLATLITATLIQVLLSLGFIGLVGIKLGWSIETQFKPRGRILLPIDTHCDRHHDALHLCMD